MEAEMAGPSFREVSQSEQLRDAARIAATHGAAVSALARQPPKESYQHLQPTKKQKQRHNIMYLAYQAKEVEAKLKETYSANRKTKQETRSKYGKWRGLATMDIFFSTTSLYRVLAGRYNDDY
ncbi:hypothetical protein EV182_006496 [Spiromyces aspiralis]|uniref:Uncharacterized protein n=1 Tax=Spiromyces aspiralis TaxID=68401 RepID=A0ACC1HBQ0_9FUNG|nr:hypothetical protein EV182_006496 [Spiromyces aspiralis]